MTEKNVLIFQGGWDGHEPVKVAARFAKLMEKNGYTCKIYDNQEVLLDLDLLMRQDLIIPCWTMGKIDAAARANIVKAVAAGTGLAGCHGGMCDAFREDVEWQFMTGGQWVSHPGGDGISYQVNICKGSESGGHEKLLSVPDKICDVEQLRHEEKRQKHCRLPDGSGSV